MTKTEMKSVYNINGKINENKTYLYQERCLGAAVIAESIKHYEKSLKRIKKFSKMIDKGIELTEEDLTKLNYAVCRAIEEERFYGSANYKWWCLLVGVDGQEIGKADCINNARERCKFDISKINRDIENINQLYGFR